MKLSLVIAQGVHAGKVIPVTGTEFLIGRDPQCQLRPASPAVSKQHCAISIRGEQVFVRDCGSTNGTFVRGEQIAAEMQVGHGDLIKVGPLEFTVQVEAGSHSKSNPAINVKPAAKAAPTGVAAAGKPPARAAATIVESASNTDEADADAAAAMLLSEDIGSAGAGTVEGISADATTVMEMPALAGAGPKAETPKKDEKKSATASSDAAAELLTKYLRRPRT